MFIFWNSDAFTEFFGLNFFLLARQADRNLLCLREKRTIVIR